MTKCPMTPDEVRKLSDDLMNNSIYGPTDELEELADWFEQQESPYDLKQELEIEQRNHKSVIDASKGMCHAWYCTSQLSGSVCNCPYKLAQSRWVSVEDWLPDDEEWRLCKTNRNGKCIVAKFKGGGWVESIYAGFMGVPAEVVTHYRDEPLPEIEVE